ncbi:MAG: pilus assembly protein PilP [Deltaproteobacteria bacterium]|nr:pilus assembly protein PilP [Deltaproteobacteria bacterium]
MGNFKGILFNAVLLTACSAFFVSSGDVVSSERPAGPIYKDLRPERTAEKEVSVQKEDFDPEKLPDPFLSYLVGRGKRLEEQTEEELRRRMEAERKRAAEEAALMKRRIAAKKRLEDLKRPRTELQRMHIGQLILTAIVQGKDKAWAMVRDETGRGFVLKNGTLIGRNGGKVFKIASNEKKVIIEEPYLEKGLYIKYKRVEMKLPDQVYE